MPGTLVHIIEDYYPNYIDALLNSASLVPSANTVLMINRILNAKIADNLRQQLIDTLRRVIENPVCIKLIREQAQSYLGRHT